MNVIIWMGERQKKIILILFFVWAILSLYGGYMWGATNICEKNGGTLTTDKECADMRMIKPCKMNEQLYLENNNIPDLGDLILGNNTP